MRKSVKAALTAAVILIICGAVLGKYGYSLVSLSRGGKNTMQKKASYKSSDIVSLSADCDSENLKVYTAKGSDILLSWDEDDKRKLEISEKDGELKLTYRDHRKWYEYLRFGIDIKTCELSIGIPENYGGALSLETDSGNISAEDISVLKDIKFSADSGNIKADGVSALGSVEFSVSSGNVIISGLDSGLGVELKNTSGNIKAEGVILNDDFSARTSSGNLKIYNVSGAKNMEIKVSSGRVEFTDIAAENFNVSASSGDVSFSNILPAKSIELKAVSGNVRGTISDDINNYTIESSCVSGNNNLPRSAAYGDKMLKASVTSGNIKVEFDK